MLYCDNVNCEQADEAIERISEGGAHMDAKVEYHRNGVGGQGYYTIALDGLAVLVGGEADNEAPVRVLAIVPADAVTDEDGWMLPLDTHIPEILVIDPVDCVPFAYQERGIMNNWRGADYWSRQVMEALHDDKAKYESAKAS